MKKGAKWKLAASIKKLMDSNSLEHITVKDIVKDAEVSRQTFYRHFIDKYDLVNWYFDILAGECFDQMGVSHTMREGLIYKFDFIRKEKRFFIQAFKSSDYNSIKQHDYNYILEFYTNIITRRTGATLSDDIQFLLELYCHGSISMTVDWAVKGMKKSSKDLADCLIDALPVKIAQLLLPELENSSKNIDKKLHI